MATIMTKQGQLDNVITYEHICDTVADMANINPSYITLGSVCIVIKGESDGLEVYMANSRKEWEIVSFGAGGSGGEVEGAAIHICAQDEYDSATGIPTIQAPLSNTFYLTPGSGETNDLYNEWIWLEEEEKWEKFGSASSGQSDWEQANTTTSDFIKNKPSIKSGTASYSILESKATKASGIASHAEGQGTHATGDNAHAEGYNSVASGQRSHAEGNETQAIGEDSHAEGGGSDAKGNASHAEGSQTVAEGYASHTEGEGTKAQEEASHAEGFGTTASGFSSHAEGGGTQSKGDYAHAEGGGARANGANSHAEGTGTTASGNSSHAEGAGTLASGANSHTEGLQTIANHLAQHVFGMNNVPDNSTANADMKGNYVEIVGNGLTNNSLSNARTLDWEGNEEVAGDIRANACGGANPISLVEVSNNVENKLNKNQGLVNAGKMLGINSEGEVQPIQVLGGNVSVTETLESGEDYSVVIEEGEATAVTSVAGKYGAVTLDAGDIEYDEQEVYNSGTVGKEVGDLKSHIKNSYSIINYWPGIEYNGYTLNADGTKSENADRCITYKIKAENATYKFYRLETQIVLSYIRIVGYSKDNVVLETVINNNEYTPSQDVAYFICCFRIADVAAYPSIVNDERYFANYYPPETYVFPRLYPYSYERVIDFLNDGNKKIFANQIITFNGFVLKSVKFLVRYIIIRNTDDFVYTDVDCGTETIKFNQYGDIYINADFSLRYICEDGNVDISAFGATHIETQDSAVNVNLAIKWIGRERRAFNNAYTLYFRTLYYIKSPININIGRVTILGNEAQLRGDGTAACFELNVPTQYSSALLFQGVHLWNFSEGIKSNGAVDCRIISCWFTSCAYAIRGDFVTLNLSNSIIEMAENSAIYSNGYFHKIVISNNNFYLNNTNIEIAPTDDDTCYTINIIGNIFDQHDNGSGAYIDLSNVNYAVISSNSFNGETDRVGINLNGCNDLVIACNTFRAFTGEKINKVDCTNIAENANI